MYDWYIGGRIYLYLALTDDQLVADEFGLGSMQHTIQIRKKKVPIHFWVSL